VEEQNLTRKTKNEKVNTHILFRSTLIIIVF